MNRSYYSADIQQFLNDSENEILGQLTNAHTFALEELQRNAWMDQVEILKDQLSEFNSGHIFFEFSIPRMGKRVDVVFYLNSVIYVLEFKSGTPTYDRYAVDQCEDYALDLKNFHEGSHLKTIIPIVVATNAADIKNQQIELLSYGVAKPVMCNKHNIAEYIRKADSLHGQQNSETAIEWANTQYKPTPTIIEAAQALYKKHDVKEISRSDSGAQNLAVTSNKISEIIEYSKANKKKSICFITGVPGAGKTLAGLNIANERHNADEGEHAVFLSGNGPLVDVLREALTVSEQQREKEKGNILSKKVIASRVQPFIQNIHHFRDDNLRNTTAPIEKVAIFDEAQRAWNKEQTTKFMQTKKGVRDFEMSEPEFLVSVMDRHEDWCTIVCLIGGGQEINSGEAGLVGWFEALQNIPGWDIYCSDKIVGNEYAPNGNIQVYIDSLRAIKTPDLHLGVSLRSFRSEKLAEFVHAVIEGDLERAKYNKQHLTEYPVVVTRDINKAKHWVKNKARGTERFGVIASSGAIRLKADGVFVKNRLSPADWFLKSKDDVRSSFFLEDVVTEFDIQGLEIDWSCVCWEGDYRFNGQKWEHKNFKGSKWQNVKQDQDKQYLANKYRVLLTRARQGMAIYIPTGSESDVTRQPEFYDHTFNFLKDCGLQEI